MWDVKTPERIALGWSDKADQFADLASFEVWSPFLAACLIHDCVPRTGRLPSDPGPNVFRVYRGESDDHGNDVPTRMFDDLIASIRSVSAEFSKPAFSMSGGVSRMAAILWAKHHGLGRNLPELEDLVRRSTSGLKANAAMPRRDGLPKQTGTHSERNRDKIRVVVRRAARELHNDACPSFHPDDSASFAELVSKCSAHCTFKVTGAEIAGLIHDRRTAGELELPEEYGFSHETVLRVAREELAKARKVGT